ncbi:MAG: VanZ family protein [Anaerolineaceae bacterium]|nr:VanZ family protein [Anaerolineaceae bacterium]
MARRLLKLFFVLVLILYLLLLVRLIVFKFPDDMTREILRNWSPEAVLRQARSANLIPFHTIERSLTYRQFNSVNVLIYNIAAFVPLGLIAPALIRRRWRWLLVPLMGLLVSVGLETIQLVTTLGEADIDDVILNLAGTSIGYVLFAITVRLGNWRRRAFALQ